MGEITVPYRFTLALPATYVKEKYNARSASIRLENLVTGSDNKIFDAFRLSCIFVLNEVLCSEIAINNTNGQSSFSLKIHFTNVLPQSTDLPRDSYYKIFQLSPHT
jgi:hypothetical protein